MDSVVIYLMRFDPSSLVTSAQLRMCVSDISGLRLRMMLLLPYSYYTAMMMRPSCLWLTLDIDFP